MRPDVVVMDIRMPGTDDIEATCVTTTDPGITMTRVLVLTTIRVVAAGDGLIAPSVTRRLIKEFAARPRPAPPGRITEREREVLTLIGRGLSNPEIAAESSITVATAKAHVARLLTKLDARDRVHVVITAYETGLVTPHP